MVYLLNLSFVLKVTQILVLNRYTWKKSLIPPDHNCFICLLLHIFQDTPLITYCFTYEKSKWLPFSYDYNNRLHNYRHRIKFIFLQ